MENTMIKSRVDFVSKVMGNMGMGLFITFVMAYLTSTSNFMLSLVYGSPFSMMLFIAAEFGLVIYLNRQIGKLSVASSRAFFYLYSALNGITLSSIFLAYSTFSIATVFLIASLMFIVSGLIGISIQKDLSAMSHFLMLALIGFIVLSIASMFLPGINLAVSLIGILLFSGLTAYDMQKIKTIHYNSYNMNEEAVAKYSIIGALALYLDFINLFLLLLRIFGKRN